MAAEMSRRIHENNAIRNIQQQLNGHSNINSNSKISSGESHRL